MTPATSPEYTEVDLRVSPKTAANPMLLAAQASTVTGLDANRIKDLKIVRRSIDARQRRVMINLRLRLYLDRKPDDTAIAVAVDYKPLPDDAQQCVVVGAGPAGLFAALQLIELGVRPVVLERGKDVDSRRADMAAIARTGRVDPDSNYCFGEGGAGAYSDGKLYTRSKKRGPTEKVLTVLWQHGASENVLIDAHPHIGTDRLPEVIKAMRMTIIRCGGRVEFGKRVTDMILEGDTVRGVECADGSRYQGPVILATGHSARDVYAMLNERGAELQAKGIAVGVRLEHPQELIDKLQYHSPEGRGKYLPAAEYSMLTRVEGRGVYSFCMCPGGFIIPAASAPGEMVVNGMSPSNRGTRWANSGMVVEVLPEDVEGDDPMRMMEYQRAIEHRFFLDGGDESQNAPAQRMRDFVEGRPSKNLPPTSYAPGLHTARIDRLLPEGVARRLQQGFREFDRKQRGFLTNDAVLIGDETRTSSPVRVVRDDMSLQSTLIRGLFPCGEGAGYAGGIVSAAVDGIRCADAVAEYLGAISQRSQR